MENEEIKNILRLRLSAAKAQLDEASAEYNHGQILYSKGQVAAYEELLVRFSRDE